MRCDPLLPCLLQSVSPLNPREAARTGSSSGHAVSQRRVWLPRGDTTQPETAPSTETGVHSSPTDALQSVRCESEGNSGREHTATNSFSLNDERTSRSEQTHTQPAQRNDGKATRRPLIAPRLLRENEQGCGDADQGACHIAGPEQYD